MTIRIREATTYEDGTQHLDLACSSNDTKPTSGVATGSTCMEADTGKTYIYDETLQAWAEA